MLEEDLTPGEALRIHRSRLGFSPGEAAKLYGCTIQTYRKWEADKVKRGIPECNLRGIEPHEAYQILRKRAGLRLEDVAERMGISVTDVRMMEAGKRKLSKLTAFWGV